MRTQKADKLTESESCSYSIEYGTANSIRNGLKNYLNKRGLKAITFNGPVNKTVIAARKAAAERAKNFR